MDDWKEFRHGWWIVFLILDMIVRHIVIIGALIGGIHLLAYLVDLFSFWSGTKVIDQPVVNLPIFGAIHIKQILLTIDLVFIVRFAYEGLHEANRILARARAGSYD